VTERDYDALGERYDRHVKENLIDPGPDPRTVQGETAARHALRVSTPEPIRREVQR
jgi:hypothetical protein